MRSFLMIVGFAAVSLAPGAAAAAPGTPASTAEASRDDQRVVCRRTVPTGSVMGRRECRTQAEWNGRSGEQANRQRQEVDRFRAATSQQRAASEGQ